MAHNNRTKLLGDFIRNHREALKMSQKDLGRCFNPPVTTQFISNIERGVTPLPISHVSMLAKALSASESEIMSLLEKEYALKLSGRLGKSALGVGPESSSSGSSPLVVAEKDFEFMSKLYDAYRVADSSTRAAFIAVCENILKLK